MSLATSRAHVSDRATGAVRGQGGWDFEIEARNPDMCRPIQDRVLLFGGLGVRSNVCVAQECQHVCGETIDVLEQKSVTAVRIDGQTTSRNLSCQHR